MICGTIRTKNEEYRFLVATKINHDGIDCKRAICDSFHMNVYVNISVS